MKTPLFELHQKSGLSFRAVLEHLRTADPTEAPKTPEAVSMILRRGTEKIGLLEGLSNAYQVPIEDLRKISATSREIYRQSVKARKHATAI